MQNFKVVAQNVKLAMQNGEIENDWQPLTGNTFKQNSVSDKQNDEQKRDKIWRSIE